MAVSGRRLWQGTLFGGDWGSLEAEGGDDDAVVRLIDGMPLPSVSVRVVSAYSQ